VCIIILFLTLFSNYEFKTPERIVSVYLIISLLLYSFIGNLKYSIIYSAIFVLILELFKSIGVFKNNIEHFDEEEGEEEEEDDEEDEEEDDEDEEEEEEEEYDNYNNVKPAGNLVTGKFKGKLFSGKKTSRRDNTNFSDNDLDLILSKDEKNSETDYTHLQKAGGGLEQLQKLLEKSANESPYKKDVKDYTPAEAQKTTYQLINTVKQLKDTMQEMTPLMASAEHIMRLKEKMKNLSG